MDHREPAERDHAEEQLRRLAGAAGSRPSSSLSAASASWAAATWGGTASSVPTGEGLPLDQPDEVGTGGEEVEVLADHAGENHLGGFVTREGPVPAAPDRGPDLGEAALQHRAVELGLGAEEIPRRPAGHPGCGPTSVRLVASYPRSAKSRSAASRIASRVVREPERSDSSNWGAATAIGPPKGTCLTYSKLARMGGKGKTSRVGRHPGACRGPESWIPAFAGMTAVHQVGWSAFPASPPPRLFTKLPGFAASNPNRSRT